jgi:hypothetical protein
MVLVLVLTAMSGIYVSGGTPGGASVGSKAAENR